MAAIISYFERIYISQKYNKLCGDDGNFINIGIFFLRYSHVTFRRYGSDILG